MQGFSSMLRSSPMFVNVVYNSLVEYQDSQPILDLSVNEFLWGYDDRLVKMASSVLPTWIDFSKFGLLDRVIIIIIIDIIVCTYLPLLYYHNIIFYVFKNVSWTKWIVLSQHGFFSHIFLFVTHVFFLLA